MLKHFHVKDIHERKKITNLVGRLLGINKNIIHLTIVSHKKRNSLDTRAVFIEFLKYVENSGVVFY